MVRLKLFSCLEEKDLFHNLRICKGIQYPNVFGIKGYIRNDNSVVLELLKHLTRSSRIKMSFGSFKGVSIPSPLRLSHGPQHIRFGKEWGRPTSHSYNP